MLKLNQTDVMRAKARVQGQGAVLWIPGLAEPVIGPAGGRTRWLAAALIRKATTALCPFSTR
jgi:hypothetical protein